MPILYPSGYGTVELELDTLIWAQFSGEAHPEFERRLRAWLVSQEGRFGIGDALRLVQPDKAGFAKPGKSFHQLQRFVSGRVKVAAVDLVIRAPGSGHTSGGIPIKWVPLQGSAEAKRWGVHCNIGVPGQPGFEVWHMQPVELDGFDSWVRAGRPDPVAGYPLPVVTPPPPPDPDPDPVPMPSPVERNTMQIIKTTLDPAKREGIRGNADVGLCQIVCNGLLNSGLAIDNDYGPKTQEEATKYQAISGLTPDGLWGPKTWAKVLNADGA